MEITETRILAGRWRGLLRGHGGPPPQIEVVHLDRALEGVGVTPAEAGTGWWIEVPIPSELLADGVQTFVVRHVPTGERIGRFSIVAGAPLDDDLRAEIDLLRAEIDLLKKAFRRHCAETAG